MGHPANLLTALLMGDSIQKVAHLVDVARQTGPRWWAWLKARSDLFAFHLKDRFPDWARMADFSGFWLHGLFDEPLSSMMAFLDQEGVIVP